MKIACIYFSDEEFALLGEIAESVNGVTLLWNAYNPAEAVAYQGREQPDLLIVRITSKLMPILPVVARELQTLFTIPFAAAVKHARMSSIANDALRKLTSDFLPVPSADDEQLNRKCLEQLVSLRRRFELELQWPESPPKQRCAFPIAAIGVSAGGPHTLTELFSHLPDHIDGTIIVAQHIDRESANELYRRLSASTSIPFHLITDGEEVMPGVIYLPASGNHFRVSGDGIFIVDNNSPHHFRPSINYFFTSLAHQECLHGAALILTGHGNDGAKGIQALKDNGWQTYVQDPEHADIPSMPEAAIEYHIPSGVHDTASLGKILRKLLTRYDSS